MVYIFIARAFAPLHSYYLCYVDSKFREKREFLKRFAKAKACCPHLYIFIEGNSVKEHFVDPTYSINRLLPDAPCCSDYLHTSFYYRNVFMLHFIESIHDPNGWYHFGHYYSKQIKSKGHIFSFKVMKKYVLVCYDFFNLVLIGSSGLVKQFLECRHRTVPSLFSLSMYAAKDSIQSTHLPYTIQTEFKKIHFQTFFFSRHTFLRNPFRYLI